MKLERDMYSLVKRNQIKFGKMLVNISKEKDLKFQLKLAKNATLFAINNGTGHYSSYVIEKVYLDIAQKNIVDISNIKFLKNSFLHVISEAYESGGHTRVLERWMNICSQDQLHSVVTTRNMNGIPKELSSSVSKKNGTIIRLPLEDTVLEKGLELRKIAMGYEYVILHTHMDDEIPLIAFGVESFTRPVIFFNHADHLFWLGVSISDLVLDIKKKGQNLTLIERGAKESFLLGIPFNDHDKLMINKFEARRRRSIPIDKKVVLSYGSQYKYEPIEGKNFINIIMKLLMMNNNYICYVIGPSRLTRYWKRAIKKSQNRLRILAPVTNKILAEYIISSDVVIDSIPVGGGTAAIEALSYGIPFFSLDNPFGQFDIVTESDAYCKNEETLICKVDSFLSNNESSTYDMRSINSKLADYHSHGWKKKLDLILSMIKSSHSVNISFKKDYYREINKTDVWITLVHRRSMIIRIRNLLISSLTYIKTTFYF